MSRAAARRLFLAALALYVAVVAAAATLLPARVPLHFDGSGQPDRYGSRTEALVSFGALGLVMTLVLGGLAIWAPRIPLTLINMPAAGKEWWSATPEREARMRGRLGREAWEMGAATLLFLAGVCLLVVRAARAADPVLDAWFWLALVAYLAYVAVWSLRVVRGNRPED